MNTRAENWKLIQRLCDEAKDDSITAARVALLNDFSTPEPFRPQNHFRHLLGSVKLFFARDLTSRSNQGIPKNLPLILFPYASGSNLPHLSPVALEAQRRGLLGLVVAGERLRPENLEGFENVISEIALWRMGRKRGIARILQSARRKVKTLVELLDRMDTRCAQRVRENYGWIFRNIVVSEAVQEGFRAILSEWKPSCVISTSDYWPFEFQLFCQAQHVGIPNAMIQHGELNDVISWPPYAETFLVWGSLFRDKLQRMGAPEGRLRVCGMPSTDSMFNRFQNARPKPANADAPICLLFSHAHERLEEPQMFKAFAEFLRSAINLTPRLRWIIRLHPAEDDSFYRELGVLKEGKVEVQSRHVSLEEAVAQADITCTIRSTAGLQAMIMQRPVMIIDLMPENECSIWWPSNGGGIAAKTPEQFRAYGERLIDDSEFRIRHLNSQARFLDETFANKGKAAASIVDYLAEQSSVRPHPQRAADEAPQKAAALQ